MKNPLFHFLHVVSTGLPWTCRPPRLQQVLLLLPKKATYVAKNFGRCKGRSKVSVDIFMASGDLLVAQKSQFLQKNREKTRNTGKPPPKLANAVILKISRPSGDYFELFAKNKNLWNDFELFVQKTSEKTLNFSQNIPVWNDFDLLTKNPSLERL